MKLNQLLRENTQQPVTEETVKKLFDVDGTVKIANNIVNVDGDVRSIKGKKFTKIPFKFGEVSGEFDVMDVGLTSCENFPVNAQSILIAANRNLASFDGLQGVHCVTFEASDLDKLVSFEHAPIAEEYLLGRCKLVTSTKGLSVDRIDAVDFSGIPNIIEVKNIVQNLHRSVEQKSHVQYNENLPLVMMTVCSGVDGYLDWDISKLPKNLETILAPYRGKGMSEALELILDLRNQGFENNAKLR